MQCCSGRDGVLAARTAGGVSQSMPFQRFNFLTFQRDDHVAGIIRCDNNVATNSSAKTVPSANGHCGAITSQSTKTIPASRLETIRTTTISPPKNTVRAQRMIQQTNTTDK